MPLTNIQGKDDTHSEDMVDRMGLQPVQLDVVELSYQPPIGRLVAFYDSITSSRSGILSMTAPYLPALGPSYSISRAATLHNISFTAKSGEITAVLGGEYLETKTLLNLITRKCLRGRFDGDICLRGGIHPNATYLESFAFVEKVQIQLYLFEAQTLYMYIPLTYIYKKYSKINTKKIFTHIFDRILYRLRD